MECFFVGTTLNAAETFGSWALYVLVIAGKPYDFVIKRSWHYGPSIWSILVSEIA